MSMTKQDFIALADMVRELPFTCQVINGMVDIEDLKAELSEFCHSQNPHFMQDRWLGYIAGENGKNGEPVSAENATWGGMIET